MVNNNTKTLLIITLLLCSTLAYAIRPEPGFASSAINPTETQHGVVLESEQQVDVVDVNCEGVGQEECLMRRTLVAHTDYIYTQKHKP